MSTILDMDTVVHEPGVFGDEQTPVGAVELVAGRFGKACRFSFSDEARGGYFRARVHASPAWDQSAGISFWVQGDCAPTWGGLELADAEQPRLRYQYEFPLDSTEWRKIGVPWCDLLPFLPDAPPIHPNSDYRPSGIGWFNFGKQAWDFEFPAHSFVVDEI